MRLMVLLIGLLAGCNAPHPFSDLPSRGSAEAGGFSFVINHSHLEAEVIRTNVTWRPDEAALRRAALRATQVVTGCAPMPDTLSGDVTLMYVEIDCGTANRPDAEIDCGLFADRVDADLFALELDCTRKGEGRAYRRNTTLF